MSLNLERIAAELPERRWFGDKTRTIESVRVLDQATLDEGSEDLVVALVETRFEDGGSSIYHLPLLVAADGTWRDATADPDRLRIFGELMAHPHPIKGEKGTFHFSGPGLDPSSPPGGSSVRVMSAEQSNTSVVLDDDVILKFFRKVEPGQNPDLEITRLLTNEGFPHIPSQVGEVFYGSRTDSGELSIDLSIAQRFVSGATEGWTYALEQLDQLYEEVHEADAPEDRAVLIQERCHESLDAMEQLGEVTAALHVLLARTDLDLELIPEPVEEPDLKEWVNSTIERLRTVAERSGEVAAIADDVEERVERLLTVESSGSKTRIHGDYHLGQVLLAARRWMILDFEGEPARSLEERRMKHSPVKDVAGMLRSFSYAAYASLYARSEPGADEWEQLEPWAIAWEILARDRFLAAYLSRSHEGEFLPQDRDEIAALLDYFEIDKALYELAYEMGHRPDWVRIPLKGIANVLGRKVDR